MAELGVKGGAVYGENTWAGEFACGTCRKKRMAGGYRGLHSSTFQLNLSALYGIGGARRDCVAHIKRVLGGV
jgi:hypothetical protein